MIYIDRNSVPIPEIFLSNKVILASRRINEFYLSTRNEKSQMRVPNFLDEPTSLIIREHAKNFFNSKCAYCESEIKNSSLGNIDNFRPKGGARGLSQEFSNEHYYWLSYEWRNIYFACEMCSKLKSAWFPVEGRRAPLKMPYELILDAEYSLLVDPCNDRPGEHFVYKEDGTIDFITSKGRTTIEILKLNRLELVRSRNLSYLHLYAEWEFFIQLYKKEKSNREPLKKLAEKWEALLSFNSEDTYLGIKRFFISKLIAGRPEIQEYLTKKNYNEAVSSTMEESESIKNIKLTKELNVEQKQIIEQHLNIELLKHIYIDKIEIKNFKCFSDIVINCKKDITPAQNPSNETTILSEPWLLFLGDNGAGKSSLLKAIAIGLCGNQYIETLDIDAAGILRHTSGEGFIKIYLVGETNPITVMFNETTIRSSIDLPIVNVLAYNSIRLNYESRKLTPEKNKFGSVRVKNLFDHTNSLINVDKWLLNKPQSTFDRVALTLKDLLLLEDSDKFVRENGKVVLKRNQETFTIEELSDGYQSVYALAIDIMAAFAGENASFDLVEGLVLIDEIGTHLHPRWRMEVVERLRKAFPKIQFVVTTHEPLCLRGLHAGEIVVLTKDENKKVIAITDLPDPSKLRVDQLLTSEFFGLKSTIDPATEKLFNEYYALLALDEEKRTEPQKARLKELQAIAPKAKHIGNSLRDEIIYHVVDELLAKRVRTDGVKITEKLKDEAVKKVNYLWNLKENI